MPGRYRVIQYYPDAVRDERINIGVIVSDINEEVNTCHFLKNWSRVYAFSGQDVNFLKEIAREWVATPISKEELHKIAMWENSIQLKDSYASLLDVDELVKDVTSRFLVEPKDGA